MDATMLEVNFGPMRPSGTAKPVDVARAQYESAETSRLNSAQWGNASDASINESHGDAERIRARCMLEIKRNPIVEGVINTHASDVVGVRGPSLNVSGASNTFADWAEAAWKRWWSMPDAAGQLSGPEWLRLSVQQLWPNGEFLTQIVTRTHAAADHESQLDARLLSIHPRRLESWGIYDPNIINGIRIDDFGRPLAYFIKPREDRYFGPSDIAEIPAQSIIHFYQLKEPGQVRGVPWLAPSLQTIADLRDANNQILDALRLQADFATFLKPTADEYAGDSVLPSNMTAYELKRRTMLTTPYGYDIDSVSPSQPGPAWEPYYNERLREAFRQISIPLMMVKLDSSGHNYSSARFDGQVYWRCIASLQGEIERHTLTRLVRMVLREAYLQAFARGERVPRPRKPDDVAFEWTWNRPPHVDPAKEANGSKIRITESGTSTVTDELHAEGKDFDAHLDKLAREVEAYRERGLTHPIDMKNAAAATPEPDDDEPDDTGEANEDANEDTNAETEDATK